MDEQAMAHVRLGPKRILQPAWGHLSTHLPLQVASIRLLSAVWNAESADGGPGTRSPEARGASSDEPCERAYACVHEYYTPCVHVLYIY